MSKPTRPNLILICLDQMRGDCLSCAGHPVIQTPYLDQLAGQGVRFSNAYSAVPSCIAARAGLYTGMAQSSHGRVGYQDGVEWTYPETMAGELTKGGYQTQAIGKMHVYPERSQTGFQNVILHDGYIHYARNTCFGCYDMIDDYLPWLRRELGRDADYFDNGLNCNAYTARPWDKPEYTHPTNFVFQQGIDFLKRRDPGKPFFLYLSLHRPHPPLDPPQWAYDLYRDREMPAPPQGDWADYYADRYEPFNPSREAGPFPPEQLQQIRAGYYGQITHIDHQLNRFMESLQEAGEMDNSFIVFTSDHGDLLGDHNLWRKILPYEGSAHIPLIVKGAKNSGFRASTVNDQVVELRDIMPTFLELADLPAPKNLDGLSLAGLCRGEQNRLREYLHGEHTHRDEAIHYITDGEYKYIWRSGDGSEQLFHTQSDPHELHDLCLASENPEVKLRFRKRLIAELDGREEGYVQNGDLVTGCRVAPILSFLRKDLRTEPAS